MARFHILLFALIAMACGGCSDEPERGGIPGDSVYDIVTLVDTDAAGSVFALQRTDQTEEVLLYSSYSFAQSKSVKPGSRLMICYVMPQTPAKALGTEYLDATTIVLYGYVLMASTTQTVVQDAGEQPAGPGRPLRMVSMWRTGRYLNMHMEIYVHQPVYPNTMVLAADPATIDDECPVLRLHYTLKDGAEGENTNTVYASFDISPIWDLPTCRRVRVEYQTRDGVEFSVFSKEEIKKSSKKQKA